MKEKILMVLSYCMLGMFVFSMIVQYNDPDPLTWISIYGAAAMLTIAFIYHRLHWLPAAILFVLTALWAGGIEPDVWGTVSFSDLFSAWEMKSILVEEGREMGGLLIVAAWSLFTTIVTIIRKRNADQTQ